MPENQSVQVTCEGAATIRLDDVVGLQGDLKSLSEVNYNRLKLSMLRHGFAFPLAIARIDGKPYGVIDGHQRDRVLKQMRSEGYDVPEEIPVTWTDCKDEGEAKRLIMQAVAQYGKIDDDGLAEFMHDAGIGFDELPELDLPDFNLIEFLEMHGPGGVPPGAEDDQGRLDEKKPIECPQCGHTWTPN